MPIDPLNSAPTLALEVPARLLIVDDEPNGRLALARRLTKRGYSVDTAEGGAEALGKILSESYDLILLDQRMPEMSGIELLKLVRATYSPVELPVIMVTGVDENQSIVDALAQGANDYVMKPVDFSGISARIQAQLARSRSLRGAASAASLDAALDASAGVPVGTAFRDYANTQDASWEWDAAESLARFSMPWKRLLGHGEDEIGTGLDEWLDRVHPQDLVRVHKELKSHLEKDSPEFRSEHRLRCKDGQYRWVLCRAVAEQSAGQLIRLTGVFDDIEDRKSVDSLTGLGNRLKLLDRLSAALGEDTDETDQASESAPVAHSAQWMLMLIDLDGFKAFNAAAGHETADELLRQVAVRLRQAIDHSTFAEGATIARTGSDEFAVLVACPASLSRTDIAGRPQGCSAGNITALGEILSLCLRDPIPLAGETVRISGSAGIVVSPLAAASSERAATGPIPPTSTTAEAPDTTPDDMMRDADIALRAARAEGGNRWCLFDANMRGHEHVRASVVRDLRHAVGRGELVAFYQPQIDLRTRRISGFEALLRWRHPEHGLLLPSEFIPLAEESGFIVPAGEWILTEACRQLKAWQDRFPHLSSLVMSVNLSVRQLSDPNLVEAVALALKETGLPPHCLKLELTESSLIGERDCARSVLAEIQAMGVGLMLDDFGTGYASLSYLSVLKFDALKIDRSFVTRMGADGESRAIIKTIVGLARELGMDVIAEGIETEVQLDMLLRLGCQSGQGFLFSKPVVQEVASQLLVEHNNQAAPVVSPPLAEAPNLSVA